MPTLAKPATSFRKSVNVLSHDLNEFVWCSQGRVWFTFDDLNFVADRDRAVWIPSGMHHSPYLSPDAVVNLLMMPNFAISPGRVMGCVLTEDMHTQINICHQEVCYTRSQVRNAEHAITQQVAMHGSALGNEVLDKTKMPRSSQIKDLAMEIIANPGDRSTAGELAARAFISERTLRRKFKEETGMSFHSWRTAVRMHHASHLLDAGRPIKEAAHECGYSSAATFIDTYNRWKTTE